MQYVLYDLIIHSSQFATFHTDNSQSRYSQIHCMKSIYVYEYLSICSSMHITSRSGPGPRPAGSPRQDWVMACLVLLGALLPVLAAGKLPHIVMILVDDYVSIIFLWRREVVLRIVFSFTWLDQHKPNQHLCSWTMCCVAGVQRHWLRIQRPRRCHAKP